MLDEQPMRTFEDIQVYCESRDEFVQSVPSNRMGSKDRGNRIENKADAIPMTSQESTADKMIRLKLPALRL